MSHTAFQGFRRVMRGTISEAALFLKDKPQGDILVFEDATGRQVDVDLRRTPEEISATYAERTFIEPRGRGRPRLGVIAKEVTPLPRHWDWLNLQPGGASVALRKLVDEVRRTSGDRDRPPRQATFRDTKRPYAHYLHMIAAASVTSLQVGQRTSAITPSS